MMDEYLLSTWAAILAVTPEESGKSVRLGSILYVLDCRRKYKCKEVKRMHHMPV